LKRIAGIFKIEPIRIIATEVSWSLFKKNKKKLTAARFITDRVECGQGLEEC
jgi:hypothetical protein